MVYQWAHQDSNLERTGYEPGALTVELWAQLFLTLKFTIYNVQFTKRAAALVNCELSIVIYVVLPSRNARSFRLRDGCLSFRSALASI
jgi:hypothetical protein